MASEPDYWEDRIMDDQMREAAKHYALENERLTAERDEAVAQAIRLRDAIERVVAQIDKVDRDELRLLDALGDIEDIARAALLAAAASSAEERGDGE